MNAEGTLLARFESTLFSQRKMGKLEISDAVQSAPGLLDEIIVSGLAMVEAASLTLVKRAGKWCTI